MRHAVALRDNNAMSHNKIGKGVEVGSENAASSHPI
jgi:hypothetical protein